MIVVEVLGRRGDVAQQVRLAALPATIGRAWTSDVVIGDPMVDPQHARIVADEWGVYLEDLGSVNGMHVDAGRDRVPRLTLNGTTPVRLGRTWLRIIRADQPVPAAVPDLAPSGRLATTLASNSSMLAVFAVGLVLAALTAWLDNYSETPVVKSLGDVVLLATAVAGWVGIWALIGRVRTHQFQYVQHHTIAWLAMIAATLLGVAWQWFEFFLPVSAVAATVFAILVAAISVLAISSHLALVSAARRGRRLALASGIVGGMLLLVTLSEGTSDDEFRTKNVVVAAALKPVPEGLIPTASIEEFVAETDAVKSSVDRKAKD